MSYSLYLEPTWKTRALETSPVWNSKVVLVLNLVLVVQSKAPYFRVSRTSGERSWERSWPSVSLARVRLVHKLPMLLTESETPGFDLVRFLNMRRETLQIVAKPRFLLVGEWFFRDITVEASSEGRDVFHYAGRPGRLSIPSPVYFGH